MRRRSFLTLLGTSAAAAWPLAARAQQPAMPVIGFLNGSSPDVVAPMVAAFRQGLKDTGYVEGQNVAIEYRWAEGQYDRLPTLAADLVRRQVTVIATTGGTPSALAAKAATRRIPIIFQIGADPVEVGLVTSLNRPSDNLTGVTVLSEELGPKRLELMRELVPTASTIAVIVNPTTSTAESQTRDLQAAARTLGLQLQVLHASTERDLDVVFATMVQLRPGALVIGADGFFTSQIERLAALGLHHSVPVIYQFREFAAAGGLMSYGSSITDAYRLAGTYTGRILKGERPDDLPVQQATRIELFINLKTAKALGLTMPTALLVRADEVIE